MNQKVKFVIFCACFVALVVGATFGYNYLSEKYKSPDQITNDTQISGDVNMSGDATLEQQLNDTSLEKNNATKAIDFVVLNRSGEMVRLSDFYGKPIVVNFWATWCGPCKIELPDFDAAYKKYNSEVEFLMVNLTDGYSDTIESVEKFVSKNEYDFPVYFDTAYSASDAYEVYSIPQTLFINKDAQIVESYIGTINESIIEDSISKIMMSK